VSLQYWYRYSRVAFTERTASAGREKVAITVINRYAWSASDTGRSAAAVYDSDIILLIARALGLDDESTLFFFAIAVDRIVLCVWPTTPQCAIRL